MKRSLGIGMRALSLLTAAQNSGRAAPHASSLRRCLLTALCHPSSGVPPFRFPDFEGSAPGALGIHRLAARPTGRNLCAMLEPR